MRLTHRMMIEGTRRGVGEVIQVPHHYLRVAAHWVRCGAGVPADERTRHAVELFEAARRLP